VPFVTQKRCPHCGQLIPPAGEQPKTPTTGLFPNATAEDAHSAQAQLIQYARDLAKVYAVQRRMAKYLPSGLRERLRDDEASSWVAGQRRQVTVLFADLVDFTRLTARLDAEEAFELLNTCFSRLVTHIYKYGGEIDKFLGDGVMAVFGVPEAHEDDPLRAVQAAWDMQMEMERLSRQFQATLGGPLQLHIGIHCGEVIAGNIGVEEQYSYTVIGATVNLAFRLQELSEPGTILVSQAIQQATQHLFRYRYLQDVTLKGFAEPVPAFVLESRLTAPAPAPALLSEEPLPWTGREAEITQLRALAENLAQGEGGVVLIEGAPGMGKTRLVREWLTRHIPSGVQVWISSAQMVQSRNSYSVWRHLTRWGIWTPSPGQKAAPASPLPATVVALALQQWERSVTREEAETARTQLFQAIRQVLIAQSKAAPLVLVIDNWQWADELSRRLLFTLLPLADQHPILFCILSRPALGETHEVTRALAFRNVRRYHPIQLAPLDDATMGRLLAALFDTEGLDAPARQALINWAQGNPFFLKEVIAYLATQGIIERVGRRWKVHAAYPLATLRLPSNLLDLTIANLDRLPGELQEVLAAAAVIGATFPVQLLARVLARQGKATNLDRRLQHLVRAGILDTTTQQRGVLAFRYAIVQESLYARLLSQKRQQLHRLVAEEMERALTQSKAGADEAALIAAHFIQAGLPERALPYLMQAGQRALTQAASQLAVEHFMAALVAVEYTPHYRAERLEIELGLADAYSQSQKYSDAIAHYQAALELCENVERRIAIYLALSHAYAAQNDLTLAWAQLEAALETLSEHEVPATAPLRGRVFAACAQLEWRMGDRRRAELWAREAAAILEGSPEHSSLAASYQTLGQIYAMLGHNELAERYHQRATAHLRATTDSLRSQMPRGE
jgi:adenylate cyclase